ncbi:hypothetical protein [Nonomuraea typhae]|uniref:hypothetical protein n=1 Tax=Nonomuraea typhae TaxID=2603600 RepID=UPI0012F83144|nr:hypothetical protein [Nonomuraea typhae]
MRGWAAVALVLTLGGCGAAVPEARAVPSPSATPAVAPELAGCDGRRVTYSVPDGLKQGAALTQVPGLPGRYAVVGQSYGSGDDTLWVGVVCGLRGAQQFATVISRAYLTTHAGRPALRWRTSGNVRHYMWLDRPGLAVYVAATPDLADRMSSVAATVVAR